MFDYDFWMEKKRVYQMNLYNGFGDSTSIKILLQKIDKKLQKICERDAQKKEYVTKKKVNIDGKKIEILFVK